MLTIINRLINYANFIYIEEVTTIADTVRSVIIANHGIWEDIIIDKRPRVISKS